jgi:hypothetical protein
VGRKFTDGMMTLDEAAAYMKCEPMKLRQMAWSGEVPSTRTMEGYFFAAHQLDRNLRSSYAAKWQNVLLDGTPEKSGEISREYLKERAVRVPAVSGVYFLLDKDGEVVYVGKSRNIARRIGQHLEVKRIKFESFAFIEYPESMLAEYEGRYIYRFNPEYNIVGRAFRDEPC